MSPSPNWLRRLFGRQGAPRGVSFQTPMSDIKDTIHNAEDPSRDPKLKSEVENVVQTNLADASEDEEFRS